MGKFMKVLISLFLLAGITSSLSLHSDEFMKKDVTSEEESALTKFLFDEVIPAFGGLKTILLNTKPSGEIRFLKNSTVTRECDLEVGLQQLKSINYNKVFEIEKPNYKIDANTIIGAERKLNLAVQCGPGAKVVGIEHYRVQFFVTDSEGNESAYRVRVKGHEQQLELIFHNMEGEFLFFNDEKDILVSHNYEILENKKEFESYIEKGVASLPLELFLKEEDSLDSLEFLKSEMSHVELLQRTSINRLKLDARIRIELPSTGPSGERELLVHNIPVKGTIYFMADGEVLPDIDLKVGE